MPHTRAKVLVVDDNPVDRDLVVALLGTRFTMLTAPDVARGYELFCSEHPDCVLLDHNLPGIQGLDALAAFVRQGACVIMLTGASDDRLAAEAFKRGARDYVLKNDLNRTMLERILAREIERRRLELDLQDAQASLRVAQRLEAIGQLAAGVAHEINTPAQYVDGNVTFLSERFAKLLPFLEAVKRELDEGYGAASVERLRALAEPANLEFLIAEIPSAIKEAQIGMGHIKNIVAAMKEFSHPSDEMQAADLNHGIATTVTIARNEWKYVANVELELAPDLPAVECFPSEINQVVLNLVVNAAHAIGERVGEGDAKGTIHVRTRRDGAHAVLEIEDDGCGIPEEHLHRIYDPFFTTKEVGKGTGQGLSLAFRIVVDHHGGTIRVASTVGKGTCFTIRLPLEQPKNQASPSGSALPAASSA